MGKVYLLANWEKGHFKIGVTKGSVEKRVKQLQTGNGEEIDIVRTFESEHYRKIESTLHRMHRENRLTGEWFELDESYILLFEGECQKAHDNFQNLFDMGNPFI